ncbi:hypothetical protein Slin15195_G130160 [Septoria linicola]|uniref:Uncharacterized protein n=1 Tax=Septoria linicola TaxID=215465 RepID=A0A9Q9B9D5_9PEZI|nr:hypothetical protein Slin14017_G122050 [Septoria linicola]USW59697.1 hypothetical protein Slin15195_G130160 [Septoria linicola]
MPCVWANCRDIIRDYLEINAVEAVQDLQPCELNELYDMLEWQPVASSSEEEVRDKKSLIAWIVRNMPHLKAADRRMETAALLKQSMQLRGVDIATPATSRASSVSLTASRRTPSMPAFGPGPRQVTPSPASRLIQSRLAPAFETIARAKPSPQAAVQVSIDDEDDMTSIDLEEPAHHKIKAKQQPTRHEAATPVSKPATTIKSDLPQADLMDFTASPACPSPKPASAPRTAAAAPGAASHGFFPELQEGLQMVTRAAESGDYDFALQTLGELIGCVWILKKLDDATSERTA